jgi:hypothetical protein
VPTKTTIKILRPEQAWQPTIGAPRGNRNALKTGRYVREKRELRRQLHVFMRDVHALLAIVDARVGAVKSGKRE